MINAPDTPLSDTFDRVYVINLRERADRRRAVTAELARLGETFTPGKVELFDAVRVSDSDGFPNVGTRGCFLSHKGVITRARETAQSVLVCEDDVQFTPALHTQGRRMLHDLMQSTWDIAFVGHGGPADHAAPGQWNPLTNRGFGSHCYAVHARCFDTLLEFMTLTERRPAGHPEGGKLSADPFYTIFCASHPIITLQASPSLATQRSSASSITPRWFDRVAGLRTAASFARGMLKG